MRFNVLSSTGAQSALRSLLAANHSQSIWPTINYRTDDAYQSFLKSALLRTEQTTPSQELSFQEINSQESLLNRLTRVFNIHHEAFRHNHFLNKVDIAKLVQLTQPTIFSLKIIFFTRNRPESFARCWNSFRSSQKPAVPVSVDIYVDLDDSLAEDQQAQYQDLFDSASSVAGPADTLQIHRSDNVLGLRESILRAWKPGSNHEYCIFLARRLD
jgi:hypothetical protein